MHGPVLPLYFIFHNKQMQGLDLMQLCFGAFLVPVIDYNYLHKTRKGMQVRYSKVDLDGVAIPTNLDNYLYANVT